MYFAQNNQRSFHRMEVNFPVTITKDGKSYNGQCLDLSSTGMSLSFTTHELQMLDEVHIQLDSQDSRFPAFNAQAKLIRVSENGEAAFTAAVEFLEVE